MARSTRQQRRQRRAQAAGTPPLRPAPRQRPAEEEQEAPIESAAPRDEPRAERPAEPRSGVPFVNFLQEAIAELKKVEWPGQQQVVSGTAVVLVACAIVGVYLYANDQVWKYVVQHLLLR